MKKIKLPKDSLVEPEEGQTGPDGFIDEGDVEGHGLPVTAPPSIGQRLPGHGGELAPHGGELTPTDVEGDDKVE